MIIKTIPTPDLRVTHLRIPPGDFSLETGVKLLIEMLNDQGIIVDKRYLEIPTLPRVIGNNGNEVEVAEFIKYLALTIVGLAEDTSVEAQPEIIET